MSATTDPSHRLAALSPSFWRVRPSARQRARIERALVLGSVSCAAALLAMLAALCQESVQRGERFRATQNAGTPAVVATAPARPVR